MDQFGASQKIVIVEDNANLSEIYKTRLEILGYEIHCAYDGITALHMIEVEQPDLVLLDLMVPKIAGDMILETMRKNDWGRDIPVFIISNLNESDAPAGIRGMGIEGYAVKANLSNDQLDKLVDSILRPVNQKESVSLESHPIGAKPVESAQFPEDLEAPPTDSDPQQTETSKAPEELLEEQPRPEQTPPSTDQHEHPEPNLEQNPPNSNPEPADQGY